MTEENKIYMNWNGENDLAVLISFIKEPIWNEGHDNFFVKCHLRELLQKCSGGKMVEMLKNILSPEEKSALVKTELESLFQNQVQSFENQIMTKNDSDKVKVKIEPLSEGNHVEVNSKIERSKPGSKNKALQISNMEVMILRFPHLAEQICQELGNQDLIKCKEMSRSWKKFIEDEKLYWSRIIIQMTTCFIPKRDILEHLLKNSNGEVVKKIGVAACETIRKHTEGWYRNVFYFALVSGQTEFLKKLIISSNVQNFRKWQEYNGKANNLEIILLYHAAERGDLEIFQFITENSVEKNPNIFVYGHIENTPLHIAAENGHLTIVELIIPNLTQKNPRNKRWRTPLDMAAENGHFDIFQLIMENVKQKNPKNRGNETPLHYAAKNGHFDICKLITEKVKSKSPKDLSGDTPLHYAAANAHFDICELLIMKVKDKNPKGKLRMTPLHYAAKYGYFAICKLISESVEENYPQDDLGYTPLQLAEQNGHYEVCQLLQRNPKRRKIA